PEGGVRALWPLFGIANQMLAGIALCLATTIILKMQLAPAAPNEGAEKKRNGPTLALVTLIPLAWLLAVTMTAGGEKIFHNETRPRSARDRAGLAARLRIRRRAPAEFSEPLRARFLPRP